MKNANMSRNAKEARRYVFVYCNDDVKLMRLRLLYSDYQEKDSMVEESRYEYEKEVGKYKVLFRMPAYKRDEMVETVGLKRVKGISEKRGWVLD